MCWLRIRHTKLRLGLPWAGVGQKVDRAWFGRWERYRLGFLLAEVVGHG